MAISYRLLPRAESDYFDIYTYGRLQFGEEQAEAYAIGLRMHFHASPNTGTLDEMSAI